MLGHARSLPGWGLILLLVLVTSPVPVTNASYADPVIRTVSTRGIDAGDCIRDPCRTIQFAIDTAADGDTIRVRQGVYEEALEIHERNSLLIEGIDANKTIILGQRVTSQIRIFDSFNIEIRDLTVRDGGDRFGEGGAVQNIGSSVQLRNLILVQNLAENGAAVAVERGGAGLGGTLKIVNCVIVDNRAASAAGAILVGPESIADVEFSTIAHNFAPFLAGQAVSSGTLIVSNSIFWNNNLELPEIFTLPEATPTSVHFSDIEGGHVGVGNIDEDPMFVNLGGFNVRLLSSSPAIDTGTNAGAPPFDLDGRRRPLDGDGDGMPITDMGAFEFKPVKSRLVRR